MDHFGLDLLGEHFRGKGLDQDLDPRLVLVVTAAVTVVHTQDGIEVADQVLPGQELVDERADYRGTAQAAADQHAEAQFASGIAHRLQADVVHFDGGTVFLRAVDGNLELARQVGEFRVEGGPLADDFTPGAWIDDFICSDTGELVGGGVAQAVAAGLDRVHLHGGQLGEDVRDVFQRRPVELYVLAGGDVGIALVVVAGDLGQGADLAGVQLAVRHGDTQHWCETLDVKAVLQAQRAEFFFAQFPGQVAAGLITELLDAVLDDPLIVLVVYVHKSPVSGMQLFARTAAHSASEPGNDSRLRLCAKVMFLHMKRTKRTM